VKEDERLKTKLCLVAVLSLCVLSMITTSARATATVDRYAWTEEIQDAWVLNQATGEWLLASGTARYSLQSVTDSAGGSHWMFHGEHNLRGVGQTTGVKYQVISTVTQHFNTKYGSAYEWTFVNTSPLISQGQESNMIFTIRNHLTINANGEMTAFFSEIEIVFRG